MTTIVATIFVLGVLVFIHELGHFVVAKWAGIHVERFSLGFPPKMIGKTIGETEYCISWVPLGGYVKMAGENPEDGESTGDPREFMSKSVGARSLVILAGPLMNFLAAIFLFITIFYIWGQPFPDPNSATVGAIMPGSPAAELGLQTGDTIVAINHQKVANFTEMAGFIHARPGDSIEILWNRDGDIYSAVTRAMTDTLTATDGSDSVVGMIGVGQGFYYEDMGLVAAVQAGFGHTFTVTGAMFRFLGSLLTGGISIKSVSGPVGIAKFAGSAAREGLDMLLGFMAILSVNLAILNILPVPVLDGGHLVFLLAEKIRRRPLTLKQRAIAQQVGMALLLLLIVTVTYNDIIRIFSG